ncbi:AmmeMemoRadiSam system radical SAM enzyme [Desulfatiferula olefinivorans]
MVKEAMLYEGIEGGKVRCGLCSHRCTIAEGKRGRCGVRENRGGTLVSLVYGRVVAEHVDPIEKKPLYHFFPGSTAYSIGTVGCNFHCMFCQNSDISQYPQSRGGEIIGEVRTPEQIVDAAERTGCKSIAYTYTEPTVFFEFAHDTAVLAQARGIKNVFVSNGFMSETAARTIAPVLDAINIDLKAFTPSFYKDLCGARLEPVTDTIRRMKDLGVWVEVTTLVIPGLNDGEDELRQIARFIGGVDKTIPWHVTAFHPTYRLMDRPRTPVATLRRARQIGLEEGLCHVYEGNVADDEGEKTCCPGCGAAVISRVGFGIVRNRLTKGACPSCKTVVAGVGM